MVTKILMVCLGNICRSPIAEGVLRAKVDPALVLVESAGTGNYHIGKMPDERSVAVASKYGIDISHQRCRMIVADDLELFDHIYVMDRSNYQNILALSQNKAHQAKIKLLMAEVPNQPGEVPDPYYGGTDGFEQVYRMIDRACEAIAQKFAKKSE
jgi:protein-tyrosine phosphatase